MCMRFEGFVKWACVFELQVHAFSVSHLIGKKTAAAAHQSSMSKYRRQASNDIDDNTGRDGDKNGDWAPTETNNKSRWLHDLSALLDDFPNLCAFTTELSLNELANVFVTAQVVYR